MQHSNTIYDVQLQKTIVLRTQPPRQATLMQPLQTLTQQFHCDLRPMPYKSNYNCVDQGGNQQHGCSHYSAICTLEFNFTMEDAFERTRAKTAPIAQTRFPPSTPGATLCEKTQGFLRFLTSKHHLDTLHCDLHSLALQITFTTASTTAAISNMDAAITMRSAPLHSTLQWRTRLSARGRRPHPSHKGGSPHRRREPLCARKHWVLCDS